MMTLGQLHQWLPDALLYGDPELLVHRIHTDTRSIKSGDLFVALKGEQFDGNSFIDEALASGAVAVLSSEDLGAKQVSGLQVVDTKLALGALAARWRDQLDLSLIAVTGSNGKTTVTQMIASILNAHFGQTALATQGNLNNDIGVPLTLFRLNQAHQAAVVELGMNHPGEISYLAKMVAPSVVLVNNAQREHLEFMKTVEAVALENGSAIDSLPTDGIVVFPADDAYSYIWRDLAKQRRTITFAADNAFVGGVDVCCLSAEWLKDQWLIQANTPSGLISYRLNIAGRHNIKNSLAAIACSLSVGVSTQSIINGLQAFGPVKGRSFTQTLHIEGRSILLIDDTYNSNPDSMKAAIDSLAEMPSPRLLVMGDMGEVGVQGLTFHAEVGSYAKEKKIDSLFTHGYLSYESAKNFEGGQHFESMDALKTSVASELSNVKSVLVKGSRFMRMERVSQKIIALDRTNTLANIGNKELPHVA